MRGAAFAPVTFRMVGRGWFGRDATSHKNRWLRIMVVGLIAHTCMHIRMHTSAHADAWLRKATCAPTQQHPEEMQSQGCAGTRKQNQLAESHPTWLCARHPCEPPPKPTQHHPWPTRLAHKPSSKTYRIHSLTQDANKCTRLAAMCQGTQPCRSSGLAGNNHHHILQIGSPRPTHAPHKESRPMLYWTVSPTIVDDDKGSRGAVMGH